MNVFRRMSDIISSNVNSALDKMEDPKKMINLMIDKMEETSVSIRASIAEKLAAMTTLERQIRQAEEAAGRWAERAKLALKKENDELAREAVIEKRKLEEQISALNESRSTISSITSSLKEQLDQVNVKLAEMKTKRDDLVSRANAAKEKIRNNETLRESESADFARKFEELQARIERWEAEAKVSGKSAAQKTVRETFEEMETDAAVEAELEKLKKELSGGSEE